MKNVLIYQRIYEYARITAADIHQGIPSIIGEVALYLTREVSAKLGLPAIKLVLKYYFFASQAALLL